MTPLVGVYITKTVGREGWWTIETPAANGNDVEQFNLLFS
jgi:hypothetical protein